MKLSLGIAALVAAGLLLWVFSPFAPSQQQTGPALETGESGEAEKNRSRHADQEEPAPEATTPSILAGPPVNDGSDRTWGELVKFRFDRKGCDTETIGINPQVPCTSKIVAEHPYDLFTDEQLRQIANHDGIAALILGARLGYRNSSVEEDRESIKLLYTAVALTGHVDALNMLMTQQNVLSGPVYINGKIDIGHQSASYVWHKTGNNLGLISDSVVEEIAQPLRNDDTISIAALDAAADERTEWFKARRQILTGGTF